MGQKELVECLQTKLIDDIKIFQSFLLEGCRGVIPPFVIPSELFNHVNILINYVKSSRKFFSENKDNNIILQNRAREISAKLIWFNWVTCHPPKKEGSSKEILNSEFRWIRDTRSWSNYRAGVTYFARIVFSEEIVFVFN